MLGYLIKLPSILSHRFHVKPSLQQSGLSLSSELLVLVPFRFSLSVFVVKTSMPHNNGRAGRVDSVEVSQLNLGLSNPYRTDHDQISAHDIRYPVYIMSSLGRRRLCLRLSHICHIVSQTSATPP